MTASSDPRPTVSSDPKPTASSDPKPSASSGPPPESAVAAGPVPPAAAPPHGVRPAARPAARAAARPAARHRRAIAALLAVLTVAAGLVVHTALADTAASDIAGDALYALLIYLLVVAIVPRARIVVVALAAALWCTAIELLQLTGLPAAAGVLFPPAMLVLGTVFDARDLLVYVVTVAIAAATDAALRGIRPRSGPRSGRGSADRDAATAPGRREPRRLTARRAR